MAGRGLRVIGGSARGVELRAPQGGGTRPTTGRLREALFAMLESARVSFEAVLDLYAGSGALGIEALSRGSGHATFIESDRRAIALLRENLIRTRLDGRADVILGRVGRWRPPEGAVYTLVLADPPYELLWGPRQRSRSGASAGAGTYHGAAAHAPAEGNVDRTVAPAPPGGGWRDVAVTLTGALAENAVIVVEHGARQDAPPTLAGLSLWRDRRHGAGAVAIYREASPEVDDEDELSGEMPGIEGDDR